MKQVLIDTSYKYLTVCCFEDKKLVASYSKEAFKSQSEMVMVALDQVVKEAGWKPNQLEKIIVVNGPGSYTGVRIAMTIAKTLSAISDIQVATVTSMQLIAKDKAEALVVLDARSDRVYAALVCHGQLSKLGVYTIEEVKELRLLHAHADLLGDGALLGETDDFYHQLDKLHAVLDVIEDVEDVDYLTPLYLKEMSAY